MLCHLHSGWIQAFACACLTFMIGFTWLGLAWAVGREQSNVQLHNVCTSLGHACAYVCGVCARAIFFALVHVCAYLCAGVCHGACKSVCSLASVHMTVSVTHLSIC